MVACKDGRILKDMLAYISDRSALKVESFEANKAIANETPLVQKSTVNIPVFASSEDETIQLSRMGKLISDHMIHSIQKAAHVQSFIEVDMTAVVNWRNKVKNEFLKREGEKLTLLPYL